MWSSPSTTPVPPPAWARTSPSSTPVPPMVWGLGVPFPPHGAPAPVGWNAAAAGVSPAKTGVPANRGSQLAASMPLGASAVSPTGSFTAAPAASRDTSETQPSIRVVPAPADASRGLPDDGIVDLASPTHPVLRVHTQVVDAAPSQSPMILSPRTPSGRVKISQSAAMAGTAARPSPAVSARYSAWSSPLFADRSFQSLTLAPRSPEAAERSPEPRSERRTLTPEHLRDATPPGGTYLATAHAAFAAVSFAQLDLSAGDQVLVLQEDEGWGYAELRLPRDGKRGWVPLHVLRRDDGAADGKPKAKAKSFGSAADTASKTTQQVAKLASKLVDKAEKEHTMQARRAINRSAALTRVAAEASDRRRRHGATRARLRHELACSKDAFQDAMKSNATELTDPTTLGESDGPEVEAQAHSSSLGPFQSQQLRRRLDNCETILETVALGKVRKPRRASPPNSRQPSYTPRAPRPSHTPPARGPAAQSPGAASGRQKQLEGAAVRGEARLERLLQELANAEAALEQTVSGGRRASKELQKLVGHRLHFAPAWRPV